MLASDLAPQTRNILSFSAAAVVSCILLYAQPESEFIFAEAPFASAHASTIVELRNGDLLSAWFGGTAEGKPDVAIWGSQKTAGTWSRPEVLVREPNIAAYNPVLFYTSDGRLWLYYKFGLHPSSWNAGRRWSDDDGKTWSPVEHLPAGLYGPIRAKPLVLADGTVVSGSSVESYHSWACWIERSTDNGRTWKRIGPITVPRPTPVLPSASATPTGNPDSFAWARTYGIIQPSVVLLPGGKLRFYARSTAQISRICISDSNDQGRTWTPARPIDVPNPNSGIDAVSLVDGRVVLVYNNTTRGRTPLNLAVSEDGEHFRMFRTLEDSAGEYSYPALVQGRNGNLHLTYTWNRKRIEYVRIPVSEIPQN
jgi:predicted neuraminidase